MARSITATPSAPPEDLRAAVLADKEARAAAERVYARWKIHGGGCVVTTLEEFLAES